MALLESSIIPKENSLSFLKIISDNITQKYVVTTLIFPKKSGAMCQFFDIRGYPVSVV